MKTLFYTGLLGLIIFEILNVYYIMPVPGSQEMNSIDVAYFLYRWRWAFRIIFLAMLLTGLVCAQWKRKWLLIFPLGLLGVVAYTLNYEIAADHMFYQPKKLAMLSAAENKVDTSRLVIGIENNGQAKAYPISFLSYHHQVQDSIGGKPVIVTYCNVCRTGRVYEPLVNGQLEHFRLVGMDHYNAMFEDTRTKSWWRQVTGDAITGKLKGSHLPEFFSTQTSLGQWLRLYRNSLVMQADSGAATFYDTTFKYENGKGRGKLTGTDSLSWKNKSWVVGIKSKDATKAYDWNQLKIERVIHDKIHNTPVLLVFAHDDQSFFAFERPDQNALFTLRNDTLLWNARHYTINGRGIDTAFSLKKLPAFQEFWHSWRSFNPGTERY
ncbi:MAG: DUF3179 domain-containing (seleno)protein [Ferruginibacter sp.]